MKDLKWRRIRLKTKAVDDCRPLIFNPKFPWWCSGTAGDYSYSIIIAFLPVGEDLMKYWDDAYDIDEEKVEGVTFTSRFAKPEYYKE